MPWYSPAQAAVASLCVVMPLLGGLLVAANYRRTGQWIAACAVVVLGVAGTLAVASVLLFVPSDTRWVVLLLHPAFVYVAADCLQGKAHATHRDSGGDTYTWGRVAVVIALWHALPFIAFLLTVLSHPEWFVPPDM